jgi:carbon-monoxide dehydrogenase small subunit
MRRFVKFEVNGQAVEVDVEPRETLLDVVRERLGLTGAHAACEQGACGACTLLVEGATVRSCLMLGVQCEGVTLTTIEGVAALNPAGSADATAVVGRESQPASTSPTATAAGLTGSELGDLAARLMDAFHRHHALQCGFCTPAMVLSALELLAGGADVDETAVRQALVGNLCRCTGYAGIVGAVLEVALAVRRPGDDFSVRNGCSPIVTNSGVAEGEPQR